jgi:molybdate transport system substrate-binding protein
MIMKKKMCKVLSVMLVLALALAFAVTGCGTNSPAAEEATATPAPTLAASSEPADETGASGQTEQATDPVPAETPEPVELMVFAAASMTETLTEIAGLYADVAPNVTLTFNFDSSGTLKTQIEEGAECDLFVSAGQRQMDQLDIAAPDTVNTDGLDFVLSETRLDLLENRVTLTTPDGNPKGINSFDDMAEALKEGTILLAMGNSDVPVGQYTQKILEYYNLDEAEIAAAGHISYGSNVKEVTTQVKEASVDCGVIYCTDAFSAELAISDYATEEMCGRVVYPAAVIKSGANPEAAQAFLDYLTGEAAMAVFAKVGFSKP